MVALLNKSKNANTLEAVINADLAQLNDRANKWNMDFNPSKTEIMIFSNKKLKSDPDFSNKKLNITSSKRT